MLAFHKRNTASQKKDFKGILPILMLAPLLIFNRFCSGCMDGIYSQHYMSDFPLFYSTISLWKVPTFMFALLVIFFKILIVTGGG